MWYAVASRLNDALPLKWRDGALLRLVSGFKVVSGTYSYCCFVLFFLSPAQRQSSKAGTSALNAKILDFFSDDLISDHTAAVGVILAF